MSIYLSIYLYIYISIDRYFYQSIVLLLPLISKALFFARAEARRRIEERRKAAEEAEDRESPSGKIKSKVQAVS